MFISMGIIALCNAKMISLGNILLVIGTVLMAGLPRTVRYLISQRRRKGAAVLIFGILLVAKRYAVTGAIVEVVGLFFVFAGSAGLIITVLQNTPVIGSLLRSPSLQPIVSRFSSGTVLPF